MTDKNNELLSYYKSHPDKFMEDLLGIKLHWYQRVFIKMCKNMKGRGGLS
jgi:hypothetical protein